MKTFVLAATVAAGLFLSASTADAQYRYRGNRANVYSYPTNSYPVYSYPSYYSSNGVVVTSGYTPTVSSGTVITTDGTYYSPTYAYPSYSNYNNGYYYNGSYYNGSYNNGVNITPSGVNWGNRRMWRW
jgi:hypothetical protein